MPANGAILSISNMKPGTSQSGTVTMANDGTIDGQVALTKAITGDSHPNGSNNLSGQLDLLGFADSEVHGAQDRRDGWLRRLRGRWQCETEKKHDGKRSTAHGWVPLG